MHYNKRWLSERFSFLSRYEFLLLKQFLFSFNFFIFLCDYQFLFSFSSLLLIIFVITLFVVMTVFIISSFSMLVTFVFLVFIILFYLCIYLIFLDFKEMTWPKHCSKLALKILRLYQVFDEKFEHCLLNLFFWRSSFEVILLHFALDNYIFYSVSIF